MSFDIIVYQAKPISTQTIAQAWAAIGNATAYGDCVVVEAARGRLFAHLNNLIDRPDCLSDVDEDELAAIRAIAEPTYNFDIQSSDPELLIEGFLRFPSSGPAAVDNDNGFIGPLAEARKLAEQGARWLGMEG